MKKLMIMCAFILALMSFTGCYSGRAVVVERPVRRVMVAPPPYYYQLAPVIVERYGAPYYRGRGRHRRGFDEYKRY